MMRLIDADEFKKQVSAITIKDNLDTDKAIALCKWIDLQPTAYDVDKVVQQLEERIAHHEKSLKEFLEREDFDLARRTSNVKTECNIAIDIVRAGGKE